MSDLGGGESDGVLGVEQAWSVQLGQVDRD
jgi:hypothetical protein